MDGKMGEIVQLRVDCSKFSGDFAEAARDLKKNPDLNVFLDLAVVLAEEKNAERDLQRLWICLKSEMNVIGATKSVFLWISEHCFKTTQSAIAATKRDKTYIETIDRRSPYKTFRQPDLFTEMSVPAKWAAGVIDAYLTHLFSEKKTMDRSEQESFQTQYPVRREIPAPEMVWNLIHLHVLPDCIQAESKQNDDDRMNWDALERFAPMALMDFNFSKHDDYPPGCDAMTVVDALPYLPGGYINWLISRIEFDDYLDADIFNVEGVEELVSIILSLPFEKYKTWKEFDDESVGLASMDSLIQKIRNPEEIPPIEPDIFCSMGMNLFFDSYGVANAFARWNERQANAPAALTPGKINSLLSIKIGQLIKYRRQRGNVSAVDMTNLSIFGQSIHWQELNFGATFNEHDLAYLVPRYEGPEEDVGYNSNSFSSRTVNRYIIDGRGAHFVRIFHAALDEGWTDFAVASLVYFFFSQPAICRFYYKGAGLPPLCDWSEMTTCLQIASTLPNFHHLSDEISSCVCLMQLVGDYHEIDMLCMSPWIVGRGTRSDSTIERKKIAESRLISLLEQGAWLKLPISAKQSLIQAELLWSDMHSDLGHGSRGFEPIVVEYGKAVEAIIRSGYGSITQSEPFKAFYKICRRTDQIPKHIDVGFYINNFMKNFDRLPDDMKLVISDASITAHKNRQLARVVLDIMDWRNNSGHPRGSGQANPSEKWALDARSILFKEGGIKSLAEGFSAFY